MTATQPPERTVTDAEIEELLTWHDAAFGAWPDSLPVRNDIANARATLQAGWDYKARELTPRLARDLAAARTVVREAVAAMRVHTTVAGEGRHNLIGTYFINTLRGASYSPSGPTEAAIRALVAAADAAESAQEGTQRRKPKGPENTPASSLNFARELRDWPGMNEHES